MRDFALTQALRYKSREWIDFHGYARNLIENGNSMLKAPKYGSLHDHLNRQSRGFASGYVFLTFLLVALNIKQICDFLKAKEIEARRAAENRPHANRPSCVGETANPSTTTRAPVQVECRTSRFVRSEPRHDERRRRRRLLRRPSDPHGRGRWQLSSPEPADDNEERLAASWLRASLRCRVLKTPLRSG
ncbi:hypothetical protein [Curtobacterium sp. PhB78]|uniref:hypothetical protein n=1 Tax=Curtobacterium sp. PhB78 TaxID=2485102 RepID=UPI0011CE0284|nr:hypothetical protein [Curtobacterium sp. PhB78]